MDLDFVYLVDYPCPKCHVGLEARLDGPPRWLKCPACGAAGLPPEAVRPSPSRTDDVDRAAMGGPMAIGGAAKALPIRPRGMAPLPRPESARTPPARLVLGTGFFLSTILSVFSLLDSSGGRAGFFGLAAVACLILLIWKSGPRPRG